MPVFGARTPSRSGAGALYSFIIGAAPADPGGGVAELVAAALDVSGVTAASFDGFEQLVAEASVATSSTLLRRGVLTLALLEERRGSLPVLAAACSRDRHARVGRRHLG
jgi:hypothetical protein